MKGDASGVRLRYSGLVIFSSRIFSVFTGLAFIVIVTRNLSISDFGVWQYLGLVLSYIIIPAGFIPYWVTRFYARGSEVAKTGVIGNLFLSIPAFFVFILVSIPASKVIETNLIYFYMISCQIFLNYLIITLQSLAIGRRPYLSGYGVIVFEVSKVGFAIFLFKFMGLGLIGAIIAVIFANLIQFLFLLYSFRDEFKNVLQWSTLRYWLKNSWLPSYAQLELLIYNLDLLILALLTKASEPLAFYRAAFIVATIVTYSSSIASVLYPRLLSGGSSKDVEVIFKITYMFGIPMAVGSFILAEPILRILKPEYMVAAPILKMMAPWALMYSLIFLSGRIVIGTETIDYKLVSESQSFRRLLKSRLFTWPLCRYLRSGVLLILTFAFISFVLNRFPEQAHLYAAMGCFLAKLISDAGLSMFALKFARRVFFFRIPYKSIAKYSLSAGIMALIIWIMSPLRFPETMFTIGVGVSVYFTSLLLLDVDTRRLFKQVWKQVKSVNLTDIYKKGEI